MCNKPIILKMTGEILDPLVPEIFFGKLSTL